MIIRYFFRKSNVVKALTAHQYGGLQVDSAQATGRGGIPRPIYRAQTKNLHVGTFTKECQWLSDFGQQVLANINY